LEILFYARNLTFSIFTSALDEKTELKVLENIEKLEPKPTCLLITHRRSVLKFCDRELIISDSTIA
jgi:ABC-type bacteriocin/lantibiotic exporter with double-glycine peptidase domain